MKECKVLDATKRLARLLYHIKRLEVNGKWGDKLEAISKEIDEAVLQECPALKYKEEEMGIKQWLFSVALKKVVVRVVAVVVAWLAGHNLDQYGVTLNPDQLSLAIFAGIEFVRNYLKVKFGWSWL